MGIEAWIIVILLLGLGAALVVANAKTYLSLVERPSWRLRGQHLITFLSRRLLLLLAFSVGLTVLHFSSDVQHRVSLLAIVQVYFETSASLLLLGMLGVLPAYAWYGVMYWCTQHSRRDEGSDQN